MKPLPVSAETTRKIEALAARVQEHKLAQNHVLRAHKLLCGLPRPNDFYVLEAEVYAASATLRSLAEQVEDVL